MEFRKLCFNSIVLRIQFRVLKPKLVKKNVAMNLVFFWRGGSSGLKILGVTEHLGV